MRNVRVKGFAAAMVVYAGFAFYLYEPHFRHFEKVQYILVFNVCLASAGAFVLSRRWVSSFGSSFFAGALYGFGPFLLALARFHPSAGFLAATIPWLFLPAARCKKRWPGALLSLIPFLLIVLFFHFSGYWRLFAVPTQIRLRAEDLAGLFAPLVMAKKGEALLGIYHVPLASLVMGLAMLVKARRLAVLLILAAGFGLGCCKIFPGVSPLAWLAIPALCCAVIAGMGLQGLGQAGFADRRWVLATVAALLVLCIVTLLLATKYAFLFAGIGQGYAKILVETAKMYILGAVSTAVIFFMVRAQLRLAFLRCAILYSAIAIDLLLGARFVVDNSF